MKSLFETIFGDSWLNFSDNLFNYSTQKRYELGDNSKDESSDDEYAYVFPLGKEIDLSLLKVNVDTKKSMLTVSYDEEKENRCVHYKYTRSIPSDAILNSASAETMSGKLTITFERDKDKGNENGETRAIPVDFGE